MTVEQIKLELQKQKEQRIEMALTDDISVKLRNSFDALSRGNDLMKQAVSQFNVAVGQAQGAEIDAKEGEEKAKFLGVDASRFTSLKKEANDLFKTANSNVKKFS
jgi:hypothetical protein